MQKIKVLHADDNAKFVDLTKSVLSNDLYIKVIGEAKNGEEAILKTKELNPDVVLMDVRMPKMNGMDATTEIKKMFPEIKIIILTIYDIDEYREAAITKGAYQYILKKSIKTELAKTIREAFESKNT